MYIGYLHDRKRLGFSCIKDIRAAKQLLNFKKFLKRTKRVSVAYIVKKGKQIFILIFSKEVLVAVFIFIQSTQVNIDADLYHPSFSSSEVYQYCVSKSDNLGFKESLKSFKSPSPILDSILKLKGGKDDLNEKEMEKLVKSIVAKVDQSSEKQISINKFLKKILKLIDPLISDQRLWRILSESQKPIKSELSVSSEVRSTDILGPVQNAPDKQVKTRSKGSSSIFAEAFSSPRKLSPMQKRVQSNMAKKKDNFSNVNSLVRSEFVSPTLTPTMLEASPIPTAEMFSADAKTGVIQDINIAFEQFQTRMAEIANQYTGAKQKYFLKLLNECSIDQFQALSTESSMLTIYGVREAETMLQSEFEGYHEQNSITRMTDAESELGNKLDGRFRKGMLSNEPNTLNEQYTDLDVKVLVSNKTLQHQANERRSLGHRNPNPLSMYEQGEGTGYSIIVQKSKHCDSNIIERPSSPENVKHIVNAIELSLEETHIAKTGLIEGAKKALADQLRVDKESISDKTALHGILFLNEEYTIERIN